MNDTAKIPAIDPQIVRWLAGVRQDMDAMLRSEAPNLYLQHTRPIDPSALDTAICAHLEWCDKLDQLFAGNSECKLEEEIVSRDDVCALGHWIHGEGALHLGDLPAFAQLRTSHTEFHRLAGMAVHAAKSGEPARAREMLRSSRYVEVSWQVVRAISDLAAAIAKPS